MENDRIWFFEFDCVSVVVKMEMGKTKDKNSLKFILIYKNLYKLISTNSNSNVR